MVVLGDVVPEIMLSFVSHGYHHHCALKRLHGRNIADTKAKLKSVIYQMIENSFSR